MDKHEALAIFVIIEQSIEMLKYYAYMLGRRKIPDTITDEQAKMIVAELKSIITNIWTMGVILDKIKEQNSETKH